MTNIMTKKQYHINKLLRGKWTYKVEMNLVYNPSFDIESLVRSSIRNLENITLNVPKLCIKMGGISIMLSDGRFTLNEFSRDIKSGKIERWLNESKPLFLDKIKRELPDDIRTTLCDCLLQNKGLEYRDLI